MDERHTGHFCLTRSRIATPEWPVLRCRLLAGLQMSAEDVWTELRDRSEPVAIEDPANPTGNDLSDLLNQTVWSELSSVATSTRDTRNVSRNSLANTYAIACRSSRRPTF
jgi:hypothetical protein